MPKLKLVTWEGAPRIYCGFCGRHDEDAELMLGPKPYICDRCVATCVSIMIDKLPADAKSVLEIRGHAKPQISE